MNILYPFNGQSVGGSHRSILSTYEFFQRKKNINCYFVIHNTTGPLIDLLNCKNIPYFILPIKNLAGSKSNKIIILYLIILNFFKIYKFIYVNKIDIVHGNDLGINLTWSVPTFFSKAVFFWHQRQPLSTSIYWRCITFFSNEVISNSKYVYDSFPQNLDKKKKLIYNSFFNTTIHNKEISKKYICSKYSINNNLILLGFAGRITKSKNIMFLLEFYNHFIINYNNSIKFHLIIIGQSDKNYLKEINKYINTNNLNRHVTIGSFEENQDRVFASFDIALMSSKKEAFGRTLIESMIQRTLVIASNLGGHKEIVTNNIDGLLFDLNNIEYLCKLVLKYSDDHAGFKKITEQAFKSAKFRFSGTKSLDQLFSLYEKYLK